MQDAARITVRRSTNSRSWSTDRAAGAVAWLAAVVLLQPAWVKGSEASARGGSEGSSETVVRLHATALVTGTEVTLADVADLEGEAARLAGSWVVAAAPADGGSKPVTLDHVQQALGQRGANLSSWLFRGASQCLVSRPEYTRAGSVTRVSHPSSIRGRSSLAHSAPPATQASEEAASVLPESLEGHLRAHLAARLAGLGGKPVVQFSPAMHNLLSLTEPTYQFRIADRGDRLLGLLSLEVTIHEGEELKQVVPMLVQVSLSKQVVVAARQINRSEVIGPQDLTMAERVYERPEDVGISEPAKLVGQRIKRFVQAGEQISVRDVEPMPLVSRNDLVTVTIRRGHVVIRGVAKAMSTGSYGATVTLKNEMSRETFSAVVTGPRTAEVVLGASSPLASAMSREVAP